MMWKLQGSRSFKRTWPQQLDTYHQRSFRRRQTPTFHAPPPPHRFHSHHRVFIQIQEWKGNDPLPEKWGWARSSTGLVPVIFLGRMQHYHPARAARTAFSALQQAVNVRALCAKTPCKWIMRILMTLLLMISKTNDCKPNCYEVKFIGRFQKLSIPIPRTAFRISEGEGGFTIMEFWGQGGIFTIGNPKAWGDFRGWISGVESVEWVPWKRYRCGLV